MGTTSYLSMHAFFIFQQGMCIEFTIIRDSRLIGKHGLWNWVHLVWMLLIVIYQHLTPGYEICCISASLVISKGYWDIRYITYVKCLVLMVATIILVILSYLKKKKSGVHTPCFTASVQCFSVQVTILKQSGPKLYMKPVSYCVKLRRNFQLFAL